MTERNSFQQLMTADEDNFQEEVERRIQLNISSTLGLYRFIGDLLNVFVPGVAKVGALGLGGHTGLKKEQRPAPASPHPQDAVPVEGPSLPPGVDESP